MHLIQLLLPVANAAGQAYPPALFARVRGELLERFGGVTAWLLAPATGLWKDPGGATVRDDVVLFEVMAESLDTHWWAGYRTRLCTEMGQADIVVRCQESRRL